MSLQVRIKPKVAKDLKNRRKIPIHVESATIALLVELEALGLAVNWPNYGKLQHQGKRIDRRHCHLQKGRPTWGCLLGGRYEEQKD
jgi:hypothetical protein